MKAQKLLLDLKIKCDQFESTLEQLVVKVSENTGKNRETIKEQFNGYFIELEKGRFVYNTMINDSKSFSEEGLRGAILWLGLMQGSVNIKF